MNRFRQIQECMTCSLACQQHIAEFSEEIVKSAGGADQGRQALLIKIFCPLSGLVQEIYGGNTQWDVIRIGFCLWAPPRHPEKKFLFCNI